MWCALRTLAGLQSLPKPLGVGGTVCGVRITEQVHHGPPMLRFYATDGLRPCLVSQFYTLDPAAFLRWQTEARHVLLPEEPGLLWPFCEWPGGVVGLRPGGPALNTLDRERRGPETALSVARAVIPLLVRLHGLGMAHLRLHPGVVYFGARREQAWLGCFNVARRLGWDDHWADSPPPMHHGAWVAPEIMRGQRGDERSDIFGLGAVLHWAALGEPPYGPVRTFVRELLRPGLPVRCGGRGRFGVGAARAHALPESLARLIRACLAANPVDRPSARELARELGVESVCPVGAEGRADATPGAGGAGRVRRVMAFVGGSGRGREVFQELERMAAQAPCLFMVVGMVPVNLPSGHLERFSARLFLDLAEGLACFRSHGAEYGLRVFNGVVPSRVAEQMVRRYAPDEVVAGRPTSGLGAVRGGVVPRLERLGVPVRLAAGVEAGKEEGAV